METCRPKVCVVQEHRTLTQHLPALQTHVRDLGCHGFFGGAVQTGADGKSGGVATLAPTHIVVKAPPELPDHVIEPGRTAAADVSWIVPGGVDSVAVYLISGEGMSAANEALLVKTA
eukprot:7559705-Pyramimonas_sp.AAC.2